MITYEKIREKFNDKGYIEVFNLFILKPPPYDPTRLIEPNIETYHKIIKEVYEDEWNYWNTWIDAQNYEKNN